MDYSIFEMKLLYLFGLQISFFVVLILFLIFILIISNVSATSRAENIVLVFLIIVLIWVSKDKLLDIPNVATKNYTVETMRVTNIVVKNENIKNRNIDFISADGNIINLKLTAPKVNNGDEYLIMYLPNSKIGVIIEKVIE
ncbi:MAG: hypothetical protein PHQ32_00500 [Firmicutes bacterium]|nr:hypothetical protein [Bacillota bacterium]